MGNVEHRPAQPPVGKLIFYIAFEAWIVGGLLFRNHSTFGFLLGSALALVGLSAIYGWWTDHRRYREDARSAEPPAATTE